MFRESLLETWTTGSDSKDPHGEVSIGLFVVNVHHEEEIEQKYTNI
jgi:hypothetical protein